MDKKIRAAIIGMGRMGKCRYKAMSEHGGYEIVAVSNHAPERLKGYSEAKYLGWRECLDKEKLDAVIVCTVNSVIPDIVCEALERGYHVFAEKPPGRSLVDARRMKECHDEHPNQILKFGFNHRYHSSIIEAKSLLVSGFLGDVVCARGVYGKAGNPNFTNEWRNNPSISGGGILLDQGIHMVDLLRYFVGDFADINSTVDNLVWKGMTTEDSAFAIMKTADGKIASLHSSAVQWKHKFDLDIVCTGGYIALNGLLTSTRSYGEERITYYRKDLEQKSGKIGNPKEYTLCFDLDESWDIEMAEFYDAVVKGIPLVNGTDDDAVKVMELITRIYESAGWEV